MNLIYELQLRILISIQITGLDFFDKVIWFSIPDTDRDSAIKDCINQIFKTASDLLLDDVANVVFVIPEFAIHIEFECITHTKDYNKVVLQNDADLSGLAPILCVILLVKSTRDDLLKLLTELVREHFSTFSDEGGSSDGIS